MTGNLYLDLAVSLAGVGVLVAVSWLLGAWRTARLDAAAAPDKLAFDEPDFLPSAWLFDTEGRAAAALSEDGEEVAWLFVVGDGIAVRRMKRGAAPVRAEGESLVATLRDPSRWTLRLKAPSEAEAAAWASRLGGASYNGNHAVS
ncbi:hypothetical protein [Amphiplicatus metriothermophilus]|uniref:Uncharacterized protein n=1 Tax=Amphiplicatus metriothermophilus TaxID=1519374 RepID=A0A239PQ64_9PROT|nr:hypothetical protein [Amphiplicatus metriothermophilus]MBB5518414.1 hypothetical protein [Amphiplicatus metriothermophilus]SNT72424.1 hypothetical protein SAMN06297382_1467 [Amphiplicatus metriothermophilus]